MPSELALLLCTGFALVLLRLDRNQDGEVSPAVWIPTLWLLLIASKPLCIWFGSVSDDPDTEGSALDRNVLVVLLCFGLAVLRRRRFKWSDVMREHVWLILMLGWALVSVAWSGSPFVCFKRWIRESVAIVMGFVVLSEQEPAKALQTVIRRSVYILVPFSLLLIKYYPRYGVAYGQFSGEQMWVGVTLQKNSLGRLCLISVFFLIWTLIRRWRGLERSGSKYQPYGEIMVLAVALFLLKGPNSMAYSATAAASLGLGFAVFGSLLWLKKHGKTLPAKLVLTALCVILGVGVVTPLVGGKNLAGLTGNLGRDATFTGRTEIWASLMPDLAREPIAGAGFACFWTPETRESHQIGEAHNGYLDVILQLGVIGLVLLVLFLLSSCRKAHNALVHDHDWAAFGICMFLMAAVHNISESSFNSFTTHLMAVLLFLTLCFSSTAVNRRRHEPTDDALNLDAVSKQDVAVEY
jgi:exopolysaccharide production protein ExoQ